MRLDLSPSFISKLKMIAQKIIPYWGPCPSCRAIMIIPEYRDSDFYFYCHTCPRWRGWGSDTCLGGSKLRYTQFEKLLLMFLDNKSTPDAVDVFSDPPPPLKLNDNTVKKYFRLFTDITFHYYTESPHSTFLTGGVGVGGALIFKPKKTQAKRHRSYSPPVMWLVGMIERDTKRFAAAPVKKRGGPTPMDIPLGHVSLSATIYTDPHTVYVNNRIFPKESRITQYGHTHHYIDHSGGFVPPEFEHIHTNTVERLWGGIKSDTRLKKIARGCMGAIARFCPHKSLDKGSQIKSPTDYFHNPY